MGQGFYVETCSFCLIKFQFHLNTICFITSCHQRQYVFWKSNINLYSNDPHNSSVAMRARREREKESTGGESNVATVCDWKGEVEEARIEQQSRELCWFSITQCDRKVGTFVTVMVYSIYVQ